LPDGLDEKIRAGVKSWQLLDGGDLRVELNARQDDGPLVSPKKLLLGLGVDEDRAIRVGVTREMLVLRPRQKTKKVETERTGAAV